MYANVLNLTEWRVLSGLMESQELLEREDLGDALDRFVRTGGGWEAILRAMRRGSFGPAEVRDLARGFASAVMLADEKAPAIFEGLRALKSGPGSRADLTYQGASLYDLVYSILVSRYLVPFTETLAASFMKEIPQWWNPSRTARFLRAGNGLARPSANAEVAWTQLGQYHGTWGRKDVTGASPFNLRSGGKVEWFVDLSSVIMNMPVGGYREREVAAFMERLGFDAWRAKSSSSVGSVSAVRDFSAKGIRGIVRELRTLAPAMRAVGRFYADNDKMEESAKRALLLQKS